MNGKGRCNVLISWITSIIVGWMFPGAETSNVNNLCAIGHNDLNTLINGKYVYQGIDSSNSDKGYWYQAERDIAIEWGNKYYGSHVFYIKETDSTDSYGHCTEYSDNPENCLQWTIWNGSHYVADPIFSVSLCSDYDVCVCLFFSLK